MTDRDQLEQAYAAGWTRGVIDYAIWDDGEQLVGCQRKLLKDVLGKGPSNHFMRMDLPSDRVYQHPVNND